MIGRVPRTAHSRYRDLLPIVWDVARRHHVDPVVVAAQFAKESGWGNFTRLVTPDMRNPCGLKCTGCTGETREDHAFFDTWEQGLTAQCQHLLGYAGVRSAGTIVDPRWSAVAPGTVRHGVARTVEELGGPVDERRPELGVRWAPSPSYGIQLRDLVYLLRGQR